MQDLVINGLFTIELVFVVLKIIIQCIFQNIFLLV